MSFTQSYRQAVKDVLHHTTGDPHRRESSLSDFILGAQDGLVNVLGVILGIAAATNDARIVLVAGLATTFAESISMGAVAFTTTLADADLYQSEREREYRHIEEIPNLEKQEIRDIYMEKGFEGKLLDHIVETVTANQDVWVAVMMAPAFPYRSKTGLASSVGGGHFGSYWFPGSPGTLPIPSCRYQHVGLSIGHGSSLVCHRFL